LVEGLPAGIVAAALIACGARLAPVLALVAFGLLLGGVAPGASLGVGNLAAGLVTWLAVRFMGADMALRTSRGVFGLLMASVMGGLVFTMVELLLGTTSVLAGGGWAGWLSWLIAPGDGPFAALLLCMPFVLHAGDDAALLRRAGVLGWSVALLFELALLLLIFAAPALDSQAKVTLAVLAQGVHIWVVSHTSHRRALFAGGATVAVILGSEWYCGAEQLGAAASFAWPWIVVTQTVTLLIHASVQERRFVMDGLRLAEQTINAAGDAILWIRRDGSLRFVNVAGERLWQRSEAQLRALNVNALFGSMNEEKLSEIWQQAEGGRVALELDVVSSDTRKIASEVVAAIAETDDGAFLTFLVRDVTERQEAQRRLVDSEQRFRAVFEQAALPMLLFDTTGRLVRANDSWYSLWQIASFKELSYQIFDDPDLDRLGQRELVERAFSGAPVAGPVVPYVMHRAGEDVEPVERHIRWWMYPVMDPFGDVSQVIQLQVDVTEQIQAEAALESTRSLLDSIIAEIPLAVSVRHEPSRRIVLWNRSAEQLYGIPASEAVGQHVQDLLEKYELTIETERGTIEGGVSEAEVALHLPTGETRYALTRQVGVSGRDGGPGVLVNIAQDHTRRRLAEEQLRASEARYRAIVEDQHELVLRFRRDRSVTFLNTAFERFYRVHREEVEQTTFRRGLLTSDPAQLDVLLATLTPERPTVQCELPVELAHSGTHWVNWTFRAIYDEKGFLWEYQAVGRDVTGRRLAQDELAWLAAHDTLTGLPNRSFLLRELQQHVDNYQGVSGRGFAVLFMDLDRFKVVNDSLGHPVGDALLIQFARRLRQSVGKEAFVARLAGDEFVAVLEPCSGPDEAAALARRIVEATEVPFLIPPHKLQVGVSIGIALQHHYESAEDILRDADLGMYQAKKDRAGDRVSFFDRSLQEVALERLSMENGLRHALERNELRLHFQPIFDILSGEVFSFEALIRWQHPERGLLEPSEFLQIAEESSLVVPLGWWVIDQACAFGRRAINAAHRSGVMPPSISMNLSARQFAQVDLIDRLNESLVRHGLSPSDLRLEITEQHFIRDNAFAADNVVRLHEAGFAVDIDEFGNRYSSLALLMRVPVAALKVDRSFVAGLPHDESSARLVRAMKQLAAEPGMTLMIEGIETPEQLAWMRHEGCRYLQGYLLSQPLVEQDALRLMTDAFRLALP
jgi:diguanylate cyclase (GGDEF)-like protein/PAS domain S-box-containing protein